MEDDATFLARVRNRFPPPMEPPPTSGASAVALRHGALTVLGFSAFFGAYNGLLCRAERVFGADSFACPMLAGGAIGSAIGACLPPPRAPNVLVCGTCTALVSAASAALLNQQKR